MTGFSRRGTGEIGTKSLRKTYSKMYGGVYGVGTVSLRKTGARLYVVRSEAVSGET